MFLPSVNHPTDKANFYNIETARGIFWFSYDTCIAFESNGKLVIRENEWNVTTGKHLNWINSDHSIRVTGQEFEELVNSL